MTKPVLTTPREADALLARLFAYAKECQLYVREEDAFVKPPEWLSLGSINLDTGAKGSNQMLAAVKRGAFEWSLPTLADARAQLVGLMGIKDDSKTDGKLRRSLDAIAAIAVRSGLKHPKFDPQALEAMPFRRSTTVVADTSGAIQGGLDFVVRHLHPAARIKIPAIVQMEIVNFAERFFNNRRASNKHALDLLNDHLMSQGGQRVLLRLELQADTEIERGFLLGDPLRSAFQNDKDPELKDLNLSVAIRAYADRLILEAARQHLAQATLGHRVQLLTSDQGLARMALAEGMVPLFFSSVVGSDLFGKRLSGAMLDPFSGRLREVSVSALLWELATAFGNAQLKSADGKHSLKVCAIGKDLSWSPYQSQADLLWVDHAGVPAAALPARQINSDADSAKKQEGRSTRPVQSTVRKPNTASAATVSFQRFNVSKLLLLIDTLDNFQTVSVARAARIIGATESGTEDYRRFLTSGGFIVVDKSNWKVTTALQPLAIALRNLDIDAAAQGFLAAPSFAAFADQITRCAIGTIWDSSTLKRAATTYRTLGEILCMCAPIHGEGVYPTPSRPDLEKFAAVAINRFDQINQGDNLVSVGVWIEDLVRKDGIHPEFSRALLAEASAKNLLRRSTEGSTTDTRYDNHVIQVLRNEGGKPVVHAVHLFRGDYLIPGKSSTSLRIEKVAP